MIKYKIICRNILFLQNKQNFMTANTTKYIMGNKEESRSYLVLDLSVVKAFLRNPSNMKCMIKNPITAKHFKTNIHLRRNP